MKAKTWLIATGFSKKRKVHIFRISNDCPIKTLKVGGLEEYGPLIMTGKMYVILEGYVDGMVVTGNREDHRYVWMTSLEHFPCE